MENDFDRKKFIKIICTDKGTHEPRLLARVAGKYAGIPRANLQLHPAVKATVGLVRVKQDVSAVYPNVEIYPYGYRLRCPTCRRFVQLHHSRMATLVKGLMEHGVIQCDVSCFAPSIFEKNRIG